jgi:tetratricopeptide (TPR) repeat protein
MAGLQAEPDANGPLLAEDARALKRLLHRALGRGFRLVVIEVDTPRLQRRIVEWLGAQAESLDGSVLDLDVGSLAGDNLWSELSERLKDREGKLERLVLALHGFQDPEGGIYRQLNVQRDLFVRDLGCFWVLLIHPYGSRRLQDIAPDFCDFSSLWIRAPSDALQLEAPRGDPRAVAGLSLADDARESLPDLLGAARDAIGAGHYADARDLLTRFELAGGDGSVHQGGALYLRSRLELSRGRLDVARQLAEQALAWNRARAEPADVDIASSLHQLADVLAAQGDYSTARRHLERALEIEAGIQGTQNHADIVASLLELAQLLRAQGNLDAARLQLERVLELEAEIYGTRDHPSKAGTLYELGQVLQEQGDFDQARRHLEHALELLTRRFGTQEHPAVAGMLYSLAQVIQAQGQLDAARSLVERALEIEANIFGTDVHPAVAASLHVLAMILREQGDIDGARRHLERALEIDARVFGDVHPNTAASLHELAAILRAQGNLDGARRHLEHCLDIELQVFGTEHPNIATTLHSLATVLAEQGDLDGALATYERALETNAQVRGTDHHQTCMTEVVLADLLLDRGERERAQTLLRHAHPILLRVFGPEHAWVQRADALLSRSMPTG